MTREPEKDFGAIADDYVFFETHSTEAESDVRAYATHLPEVAADDGIVNMLDFGCGSGSFTARFLNLARWPPERLKLTLVDPAEDVRRQAVARLCSFTNSPVTDSAVLLDGSSGCFDLVLSNHVFYYVPDLENSLRRLIAALSLRGTFLTAIAGYANALIEFWIIGFGLIGREIPYNTSEDVEAAFRNLDVNYQKQQIPYEICFEDNHENRMRMIRFLLANHLQNMPLEPLLALFDKYSNAGRIQLQTASEHYALRASENRF